MVEHRPGTGRIAERLAELAAKWRPCAVVVDPGGPAGSLIPALEAAGIALVKPTARDVVQATGAFLDAVTHGTLRHRGQVPLTAAAAGARLRPLGDAHAFTRKGTTVVISPLVAAALARWAWTTRAHLPRDVQLYVVEAS